VTRKPAAQGVPAPAASCGATQGGAAQGGAAPAVPVPPIPAGSAASVVPRS